MKKSLFIIVVSLFPLTSNAMVAELLFENTEGVLCLSKLWERYNSFFDLVTTDSVPLAYRDTILPDGTPSRSYFLPYSSLPRQWPEHFFILWQFPDGVRVLLDKKTPSFLYPSGLQPGLYNFVSEYIKIKRDIYNDNPRQAGGVRFEYLNAPKQDSPYSKPYRNQECEYRGTSMYANVKVLDESQAFVSRDTPKFYVRVIKPDSKEQATFDVHPVVNHQWGTECAQWRWVDCEEDFCVIFGFGGDFTIRIIDK